MTASTALTVVAENIDAGAETLTIETYDGSRQLTVAEIWLNGKELVISVEFNRDVRSRTDLR